MLCQGVLTGRRYPHGHVARYLRVPHALRYLIVGEHRLALQLRVQHDLRIQVLDLISRGHRRLRLQAGRVLHVVLTAAQWLASESLIVRVLVYSVLQVKGAGDVLLLAVGVVFVV